MSLDISIHEIVDSLVSDMRYVLVQFGGSRTGKAYVYKYRASQHNPKLGDLVVVYRTETGEEVPRAPNMPTKDYPSDPRGPFRVELSLDDVAAPQVNRSLVEVVGFVPVPDYDMLGGRAVGWLVDVVDTKIAERNAEAEKELRMSIRARMRDHNRQRLISAMIGGVDGIVSPLLTLDDK